MQPIISGDIKLSHGEAYLPHDKGSVAAPNRLASNESRLPSGSVNRAVASRYLSRFFNSQPAASRIQFPQPSGKKASMLYQFVHINVLPSVNTMQVLRYSMCNISHWQLNHLKLKRKWSKWISDQM